MLTTLTTAIALAPALSAAPAYEVTRIKTFPHIRTMAVAGAPSGSTFAVALEDFSVKIMDAKTLQSTHTLTGHPRPVLAMAFSPDGSLLATADESARLWLWNTKTGERVREFPREKGHQRAVQAIAFSQDGQSIATVGQDDQIKIWKRAGGHPTHTIFGEGANFYGVAFSPGGGLYTATLNEGLRIYKPGNFALLAALPVPGGQGANNLAIDKKATTGITADRTGNVSVFDLRARKRTTLMKGHMDWVLKAAISPNGEIAATSSNDMTVRIWDMKSKTALQTIEDQSAIGSPLAFTGNGMFLVTANSSDQLQVHVIQKK